MVRDAVTGAWTDELFPPARRTRLPGGYMGRVLRVDLSSGTFERQPYPVARLIDGRARAILFDSAKCIGCRQYVEACKDWRGLLTVTGGIGGKWRAVKNAFSKPWRLRYRYWHRAESLP